VAATRGNLNNDIGLPLTLLGCRDQDYLVLELGANHSGEIAYLSGAPWGRKMWCWSKVHAAPPWSL